jgi:hypothetical protein
MVEVRKKSRLVIGGRLLFGGETGETEQKQSFVIVKPERFYYILFVSGFETHPTVGVTLYLAQLILTVKP